MEPQICCLAFEKVITHFSLHIQHTCVTQGAVRKRAKKQQEQTSMAILGSCNSPYDNVVIPSFECGPALVCSSEDPERVYIICD